MSDDEVEWAAPVDPESTDLPLVVPRPARSEAERAAAFEVPSDLPRVERVRRSLLGSRARRRRTLLAGASVVAVGALVVGATVLYAGPDPSEPGYETSVGLVAEEGPSIEAGPSVATSGAPASAEPVDVSSLLPDGATLVLFLPAATPGAAALVSELAPSLALPDESALSAATLVGYASLPTPEGLAPTADVVYLALADEEAADDLASDLSRSAGSGLAARVDGSVVVLTDASLDPELVLSGPRLSARTSYASAVERVEVGSSLLYVDLDGYLSSRASDLSEDDLSRYLDYARTASGSEGTYLVATASDSDALAWSGSFLGRPVQAAAPERAADLLEGLERRGSGDPVLLAARSLTSEPVADGLSVRLDPRLLDDAFPPGGASGPSLSGWSIDLALDGDLDLAFLPS